MIYTYVCMYVFNRENLLLPPILNLKKKIYIYLEIYFFLPW